MASDRQQTTGWGGRTPHGWPPCLLPPRATAVPDSLSHQLGSREPLLIELLSLLSLPGMRRGQGTHHTRARVPVSTMAPVPPGQVLVFQAFSKMVLERPSVDSLPPQSFPRGSWASPCGLLGSSSLALAAPQGHLDGRCPACSTTRGLVWGSGGVGQGHICGGVEAFGLPVLACPDLFGQERGRISWEWPPAGFMASLLGPGQKPRGSCCLLLLAPEELSLGSTGGATSLLGLGDDAGHASLGPRRGFGELPSTHGHIRDLQSKLLPSQPLLPGARTPGPSPWRVLL